MPEYENIINTCKTASELYYDFLNTITKWKKHLTFYNRNYIL
jgi:hypothetical protein